MGPKIQFTENEIKFIIYLFEEFESDRNMNNSELSSYKSDIILAEFKKKFNKNVSYKTLKNHYDYNKEPRKDLKRELSKDSISLSSNFYYFIVIFKIV
jgi:hypothetical protein